MPRVKLGLSRLMREGGCANALTEDAYAVGLRANLCFQPVPMA